MDDLQDHAFPITANSNFGIAEDSDSLRSATLSPEHHSDSSLEEASKKKKAPAPNWGESGASVPKSPSNGSLTPTSTISSSSKYDAKALLNPKSKALPRGDKRVTPTKDQDLQNDDHAGEVGMSLMLGNIHGLKSRESVPNKRRKVGDLEFKDEEVRPNGSSERIETNGQLGLALREAQQKLQMNQSSSVVDLTGRSALTLTIHVR